MKLLTWLLKMPSLSAPAVIETIPAVFTTTVFY